MRDTPPLTSETLAGMALAGALEAARYGGDSGEDVDRDIAELAKRGYRLTSDADDDEVMRAVDEARRHREAEARERRERVDPDLPDDLRELIEDAVRAAARVGLHLPALQHRLGMQDTATAAILARQPDEHATPQEKPAVAERETT